MYLNRRASDGFDHNGECSVPGCCYTRHGVFDPTIICEGCRAEKWFGYSCSDCGAMVHYRKGIDTDDHRCKHEKRNGGNGGGGGRNARAGAGNYSDRIGGGVGTTSDNEGND